MERTASYTAQSSPLGMSSKEGEMEVSVGDTQGRGAGKVTTRTFKGGGAGDFAEGDASTSVVNLDNRRGGMKNPCRNKGAGTIRGGILERGRTQEGGTKSSLSTVGSWLRVHKKGAEKKRK